MNLCQSISEIKETLIMNNEKFTPYPKDEIQQAIDYFGKLPNLLLEYYKNIGEAPETYYYVFSPIELIARNPDFQQRTMIYIGGDICDSFYVYFKTEERNEDNPSLWADNMDVDEILEEDDDDYVSGEKYYQHLLHNKSINEIYGLPRFRNLSMYLTTIGTPLN